MTDIVTQPEEAQGDSVANADCSDAVDATPRWSFDADTQGWRLANPSVATLDWSDAHGMPSPGALLVQGDSPPDDDLFVYVPIAFRDLSGTIITLNVLLESSGDIAVKLFAQSGDSYLWADGGIVRVAAGEWTCLAFDLEAPVYRTTGFDPTRVRRVGIGINGVDFRVVLDTLSY